MFGLFNKKKKGGGDEPPQNHADQDQSASDDDAEFYQAVVNKFVTMLDAHVDANPDMPEFRDRWMFKLEDISACLLYTSPSPRDRTRSRMPSSA